MSPNANSTDENIKKKNDKDNNEIESIEKLILRTKLYSSIQRTSAVRSIDKKFKLFSVREEKMIKKIRIKNSMSEKKITFN